ncbi:MAG: ABC transporter permease, partial [Nitrospirae bacterium]
MPEHQMRAIMFSPRWRKVIGDLRATGGRITMMVLTIAVGIFGVGTILNAYTILTREISRNYLGTNPASAQLEIDRVDDSLVEAVRLRPGIADAEASSAVVARIEKKHGEWMPALLFVIKNFNKMRINTFQPESGAWPPLDGSILLEREALPLINAKVGDSCRIQTPNGQKHEISISGLVHDPGLAPAWQEQTVYGYITPSTLTWLGEGSTMHILKVTVKNQPLNVTAIEQTIVDLAVWLKQQGYKVGEIRIPPPGKHPHQTQMMAILILLLIFGILAMMLSAILTATVIGGILAQQIRQIGVMKAIGARTRQIAGLYLVLVILMGIAAVILGLPPGIAAGRGFARIVAQLLN